VAKNIFHGVLGVVDRRGERVLWCHTVLDVEDYVAGVRGNEPAETVVSTMILESKPTAIEIDQHGMRVPSSASRLPTWVVDMNLDGPPLVAR
jgi:hypothetical protein